MSRWAKDATELIGRTPLVELKRLASHTGATILTKLEMFSPGGIVKDRVAWQMICEAEMQGLPGRDVVSIDRHDGLVGFRECSTESVVPVECHDEPLPERGRNPVPDAIDDDRQ